VTEDELKAKIAELEALKAEVEAVTDKDKPLWERLPDRFGTAFGKDVKLCRLLHCDKPHYAKGLCHPHYKYNAAGKLDPQTGGVFSGLQVDSEIIELPNMGKVSDWVYIQESEEFIHKASMRRLRFKAALMANGDVLKSLIRGKKFETYFSVKFEPYQDELEGTTRPKDDVYFNMYQPGKVMWPKGIQVNELPLEIIELFKSLGGSDSYYLERWLANLIRNPGKPGTALILKGIHGSGKGTLGTILRAIYKDYSATCSLNEIENGFSSWVENKLVMMAEEVSAGSTKQIIRTMNELKKLIAGGPMFINRKMVPQYESNICARWLIFSNAKTPMIMEPTERRYWVIESFNKLDPAIGKKIGENPEFYARELVNYLHFAHLDATDPWEVYESEALKRIKEESKFLFL